MSTYVKELVIQSTLDEIARVESYLETLHQELSIREDAYGNLMIAVTEAVNNSIFHGNQNDPRKKVAISSELIKPFLLKITVQDEGKGFDITRIKDPTSPENLLNENGRGIYVIRNLADFSNWVQNTCEMQFNI